MREILFRGKLANGKWAYGNLDIGYNGVCIITPDRTLLGSYGQVDPETVGQYTGLKDKNGQRIFEGDVVEQNWYDFMEPADDSFGVVIFCEYDCSFSVMDAEDHSIKPLGSCTAFRWEAKVIGNIHDNPELVKEEPK